MVYDRWYSEASLATNGAIDRALERLRKQDHVYEKDGALWFRATAFGDEKDRVVVRENGVKTYFASDIAYHLEKRERGFELLLDILGSDHHGYTARVRAGLQAMGEPPDSLEVQLVQFVSLFRGGEKAAMSTRAGEFVTLRQLRAEVGNDAARFFYVMRSHDQPLDFDLELAKSRSNENPVYYIQYAHARVASVGRQLASKGYQYDAAIGLASLATLTSPHETALLTLLGRYPEMIQLAGQESRAAHAGALPARTRAGLPHLVQRRAVHRRGRAAAQCPHRAGTGHAAGGAQRPRRCWVFRRRRPCEHSRQRMSARDYKNAGAQRAASISGSTSSSAWALRVGLARGAGGVVCTMQRAQPAAIDELAEVAARPKRADKTGRGSPPTETAADPRRTTPSTTCCRSSK